MSFFIADPVDDTWSIEKIARESPPAGWASSFKDMLPRIAHVSKMVEKAEGGDYISVPPREDIFAALELVRVHDVKIIIIGQDPYHSIDRDGRPQACGLSFSTRRGHVVPPSLRNIYKELKKEYPDFVEPDHGDLTSWARQGVLLLNAALTTKPGQAGAHGQIWKGVISAIIQAVANYNPECIMLLWGKNAEKVGDLAPESMQKLICAHPSPVNTKGGFLGCNHFRQANQLLVKAGLEPIDWKLPR